MKIFVKVKPRARENRVEKIDDTHFNVFVTESPEKGRANKLLIKLLSDYFNLPTSQISIISGFHSKEKSIELKK